MSLTSRVMKGIVMKTFKIHFINDGIKDTAHREGHDADAAIRSLKVMFKKNIVISSVRMIANRQLGI